MDDKDTNFQHSNGPHDNLGEQLEEEVLEVEVEDKARAQDKGKAKVEVKEEAWKMIAKASK